MRWAISCATVATVALIGGSRLAHAQEVVECESVSARLVDGLAPDAPVVRCRINASIAFDAVRAKMVCSTVPCVSRRYTVTGRVCP